MSAITGSGGHNQLSINKVADGKLLLRTSAGNPTWQSDWQHYGTVAVGALFYSPVDFTDASDLNNLMQVW